MTILVLDNKDTLHTIQYGGYSTKQFTDERVAIKVWAASDWGVRTFWSPIFTEWFNV